MKTSVVRTLSPPVTIKPMAGALTRPAGSCRTIASPGPPDRQNTTLRVPAGLRIAHLELLV
jgi:hypothetical protein